MACCTCCCENKGRVCCNNVCCQTGQYCCGTTCCPDANVCCADVCCAVDEVCCGGECCPEGYYCCGGVCQEDPCDDCAVDGDCVYWVASVDGYANAGCDATVQYTYFNSEDEALAYGEPFASDGDCGTVLVYQDNGICCDGQCYPSYGELPFGTNDNNLSCP